MLACVYNVVAILIGISINYFFTFFLYFFFTKFVSKVFIVRTIMNRFATTQLSSYTYICMCKCIDGYTYMYVELYDLAPN